MVDVFQELRELRLRNSALEARLSETLAAKKQLEDAIKGPPQIRIGQRFGMTNLEAAMLALLVSRAGNIVTRTLMYDVLYAGHPVDSLPDPKIFDVVMSRLRRKLRPYAIIIATEWGRGYLLSREAGGRVEKLIAEQIERGKQDENTNPCGNRDAVRRDRITCSISTGK